MSTPENNARNKINKKLQNQGWTKLSKDEEGTGYKEEVFK